MASQKINCTSCGFLYPKDFIKYHQELPYCDICSLDYLMNYSSIYLPSFYISKTHQENFMILFDDLSRRKNKKVDWISVITAYIESLPSIYGEDLIKCSSFVQKEILESVPLLWQFDFIVFEFNESKIGTTVLPYSIHFKLKKNNNGIPVQNKLVRQLSENCQLILKLGYFLQFNIFTVSEILELLRQEYLEELTPPYKKMVNEIIRYSQLMKNDLVR
ncbi:hypothetical protein WMO40_20585 [Bacillaceae bacterium CLA-AA-H227]|uniref:Uncharacterized protein n=1 Tax=Robertmurraya yapensis (ex Hitch et al 2024) TaxID=3133160 RepID=A0ACC6SGI4_9BACI